jgi:uncharacterized protein YkwD
MDRTMTCRFLPLLAALSLPCAVSAQSLAEQVLEQTNVARWQNGQLPPLKGHALLDQAARGHSQRMGVADFFMHCDPDTGKAFSTRISDTGYAWNAAAENIAAGSSTAAAVMNQWMNSSGHRANILSTSYNELGVGYHDDPNDGAAKRHATSGCTPTSSLAGNFRHYWTQNFGRRASAYPVVIAREAYQTAACGVPLYLYGSGFATQMRFSNDGGQNWSSWQTFNANPTWTLSGAAGTVATVNAEIRNGSGTVRSASDSIRLGTSCGGGGGEVPPSIFKHGFE